MDHAAIEKFAVWAHAELVTQLTEQVQKMSRTETHLAVAGQKKEIDALVEEAASEWFCRVIALRFMEINGFLPGIDRLFADDSGRFQPAMLKTVVDIDLPELERQQAERLKENSPTHSLYLDLFLVYCRSLRQKLPCLFGNVSFYLEKLLPQNLFQWDGVVHRLVRDIPDSCWRGKPEIIGWLYQYFIAQKRDEIININKGVIKKEDISIATQVFTTEWVVRYMVDNSLGRYWLEHQQDSRLEEQLKFYVPPIITADHNNSEEKNTEGLRPQTLTFLDPCVGCGHILVYAFKVYMAIYREQGYSEAAAAAEIIKHNLFGIDIDDRCVQIASFVLTMTACSYDSYFLERDVHPHIVSLQESSHGCVRWEQDFIAHTDVVNGFHNELLDAFRHAKEVGALLKISPTNPKLTLDHKNFFQRPRSEQLLIQAELLSRRYSIVCTNPPYLNKFDVHLKTYLLTHYKDYSADLFSAFIYRNLEFCEPGGYTAYMTPLVWMFIKRHEPLRRYIVEHKTITSLIQMEYSAFKVATVPLCTFVVKNEVVREPGIYFRLSEFKGGMAVQEQKVLEALRCSECCYRYVADQRGFASIPGVPIAYWASPDMLAAFAKGRPLSDYAIVRTGIQTGDNRRFLRYWWEVKPDQICYDANTATEAIASNCRWFPYNKGGRERRWFGNEDYVVDWSKGGSPLFGNPKAEGRNAQDYPDDLKFKPAGTWSLISSGRPSFRYKEHHLSDFAGMSFYDAGENLYYLLGFCNSVVASEMLQLIAPTINYQVGDVARLPVIESKSGKTQVSRLVEECIAIARLDWEERETSWHFECHPLVQPVDRIEDAFGIWERRCRDRRKRMQLCEEAINRYFIQIYKLEDELQPAVSEQAITLHRADLKIDIRNLISYAVGCILGRYDNKAQESPTNVDRVVFTAKYDSQTLAYNCPPTGSDLSYQSKQSIVPICSSDQSKLGGDLTSLFINWVESVYGTSTLSENLQFIAYGLTEKQMSEAAARRTIRRYFLREFYADHLKMYRKRPIYWLFDSGRKGSFKGLMYIHRFQKNTLPILRDQYLLIQLKNYNAELAELEKAYVAVDSTQRQKFGRRINKLSNQIAELQCYIKRVESLINTDIRLELADGIAHNYAMLQDILAPIR